MRLFRRRRRYEPMPAKFRALLDYNTEVARGLVHTPEWAARMARLQADYNAWAVASIERERTAPRASASASASMPVPPGMGEAIRVAAEATQRAARETSGVMAKSVSQMARIIARVTDRQR